MTHAGLSSGSPLLQRTCENQSAACCRTYCTSQISRRILQGGGKGGARFGVGVGHEALLVAKPSITLDIVHGSHLHSQHPDAESLNPKPQGLMPGSAYARIAPFTLRSDAVYAVLRLDVWCSMV